MEGFWASQDVRRFLDVVVLNILFDICCHLITLFEFPVFPELSEVSRGPENGKKVQVGYVFFVTKTLSGNRDNTRRVVRDFPANSWPLIG